MKLLVVLCLMLIGAASKVSSADTCTQQSDVGNVRLLSLQRSVYEGVVQVCNTYWLFGTKYVWDYVTTNGWMDTAAQVVCRQLGFPHLTAQSFPVRLHSKKYQVTRLTHCNECNENLLHCLPQTTGWRVVKSRDAAALNCYCQDGAMRLVNGSNNKEGRVEVCVDGRWGAIKVCREQDQMKLLAGHLCYQLGFSGENAEIHHFGSGYGLFYMCHDQISDNPDCSTVSTSGCENYTQAVGVRCQAREDTCETIITDTPTPEMMFTNDQTVSRDIIPVSPTSNTSEDRFNALETTDTDRSSTNPSVDLNTTPTSFLNSKVNAEFAVMCENGAVALGVLTGLLTAALVIVTTGWIVSCVYWQRKSKQTNDKTHMTTILETSTMQRQLDNPVYGGSTGTHSQTNYSSTDPTYEHVEANDQTGYDVINRRGAPRPHPPMTPLGSHDPTSKLDYSILEGTLESSNMTCEAESNARPCQGDSRHSNRQEPPNGDEPQNYEIPNSRTSGVINI